MNTRDSAGLGADNESLMTKSASFHANFLFTPTEHAICVEPIPFDLASIISNVTMSRTFQQVIVYHPKPIDLEGILGKHGQLGSIPCILSNRN